jgi:hypothetical protein
VIDHRIDSFIKLSKRLGKEKLIWRYDPLLLSDSISVNDLIENIRYEADRIGSFTEKLVFSFIDIEKYKKVRIKTANTGIREFDEAEKLDFAKKLCELNKNYGFELASCAEEIDLTDYGINKNKCIDDMLIRKVFSEDEQLAEFISQTKNLKDKGQRKECKCIASKDIGKYNTCINGCVYCYAVSSDRSAKKNYLSHIDNVFSESLV